jgi:YD repeat-containing protein
MKMISGIVLVLGLFLFTGIAIAGTVKYTYDDAGRLIKADYGGGKAITYTYDKAGNLLSENTYVPSAPALGALTPSDVTTKAGTAQILP